MYSTMALIRVARYSCALDCGLWFGICFGFLSSGRADSKRILRSGSVILMLVLFAERHTHPKGPCTQIV